MPAGNVETRSSFGGLIKGVEAAFMDVFDHTTKDYSPSYSAFMKTVKTDKERERFTGVAGPGNLVRKDEGDNFTRASRLKTYNTEIVPVTYGKMIEATMEEIEDQDFKSKLDAAKHLTRRGLTTKDRHVFQLFNDGFSTSDSLTNYPISRYGDGVPMFSTVHPRKDGGTAQSNASATGITFGEENLDIARQALFNQLEDDGTPIDTMGKMILLVPLALEKLAVEVTQSKLRSGTGDNDMNFYEGMNVDVIASKYLGSLHGGSDTAWYLVMPEMAKLILLSRKELTPRTSVDEDNLNVKYSVNARWAVGYWDWRGMWGSKGDGLAYSS